MTMPIFEPVAWLFKGFMPGCRKEFASIDSRDSQTWPTDDGMNWSKSELFTAEQLQQAYEDGYKHAHNQVCPDNIGVPVSAKTRFDALMQGENESPLERLRFFLSLALTGQDWLDVEPFLDALPQVAQEPVGYQQIFDAIAKATWVAASPGINISVEAFTKSIGPLYAAPPAPAVPEWQPIETAPKDTAILLYCGSYYELGHFNTAINAWVSGWDHRPLRTPNYWMPLPASPEPTK